MRTAATSYPYGEEIPALSYEKEAYNYGFTGHMKDNALGKGLFTTLYREYDTKNPRWWSVDPLRAKYPSISPYAYCNSNPINRIDRDGGFDVPVHERIINKSITNSNLTQKFSQAAIQCLITGATWSADGAGGASDWHFDGRTNFKEVDKKWNELNFNIKETISNIGWGNKKFGGYDVDKLGNLLHNVEDFYSHSNYIELYIEYFKSINDGKSPSSVPIYEDGLKLPGFKSLMERETYDKDGKYQGLHTGIFEISKAFSDDGGKGPNSHYEMNKDKAEGDKGQLAEKVAQEHTSKLLKEINE